MKIAIVGGHRDTRLRAPFGDPNWTIWGFSYRNRDLPRVDEWFELHAADALKPLPFYRGFLPTLPVVWMREIVPDIPGSLPFPRLGLVATFGQRHFTSTAAWIMAMALWRKPEAIGLWGIEGRDEYGNQAAGIRHFASLAEMQGIRVTAATGVLDPAPLYAFEE